IAASDTRAAWTRSSPRPQRLEAAALRGLPVYFDTIEPWTKADRTPEAEESATLGVLAVVLVVILVGSAWLAAGNLRRQRGDRRGAVRLAGFVFCTQMLLFLTRAHLNFTMGSFGVLILSLATATFYAVVMWTLYLALEPYVRRRWP